MFDHFDRAQFDCIANIDNIAKSLKFTPFKSLNHSSLIQTSIIDCRISSVDKNNVIISSRNGVQNLPLINILYNKDQCDFPPINLPHCVLTEYRQAFIIYTTKRRQ